jgi:hypothetical protein
MYLDEQMERLMGAPANGMDNDNGDDDDNMMSDK